MTTPTVIAAGSFATGGSGFVVAGAGAALDEWDLVAIGSETTVDAVTNAAGSLAPALVDATSNQGAYIYLKRATGAVGADLTIDTNGDHRTAYVWLRLPSNVTAVDVSGFVRAAASAETFPASDTGALAGVGDELVIYVAAGQDFSGGTTPQDFAPSAGYTTLAVPIIGVGGESTAHFVYVSYRDDAGPSAEAPNVTWGNPPGNGSQNVRHRYAMWAALATQATASTATLDASAPAATFSADATSASAGQLDASAPAATLTATGDASSTATLNASAPAATLTLSAPGASVAPGTLTPGAAARATLTPGDAAPSLIVG